MNPINSVEQMELLSSISPIDQILGIRGLSFENSIEYLFTAVLLLKIELPKSILGNSLVSNAGKL